MRIVDIGAIASQPTGPTVPANIVVPWPSTEASIPSGWSRLAALDGYYIQGAVSGGDADLTARGNATHSHTSPSHGTSEINHNHNVSAIATSGSTVYNTTLTKSFAPDTHLHDVLGSEGASTTSQTVAITVNATADNDPPYRKVLWIESDGSALGFPSGAYAFFDSDSLPASWSRVEANNMLKGASAGNSGTGTGGSSTHVHVSPAHSHTADAHDHVGESEASDSSILGGTGSGTAADGGHTHTYTLNSTTPTSSSVTITINSSDGVPVYKKLNIISNGGSDSMPSGIIGYFNGLAADVPSGWSRYTAMDEQFAVGCSANGQVGTTGGSLTHSHTASSCQPTGVAHTHSITQSGGTAQTQKGTGTTGVATTAHTHTWDISNETISYDAVAVTINSSSSEASYPPYKRLIMVIKN